MQHGLDFLLDRVLTVHGIAGMAGLLIYAITSHTRRQRRHPSAAIAWVISLALLPYLSLPLYLLFGSRKIQRDPTRPTAPLALRPPCPATTAQRFQYLAAAMGLPGASAYRQLSIHEDGAAALEALRSVVLGAADTLDLSTFLLGRDPLGQEVTALLMQCARKGVRVRLLIDGLGIYLGGRPKMKQLRAAGVHVALFVSPWHSPRPGRTNLRNHRKLVIADGQRLWTGGRNLAAEYFVGDPGSPRDKPPWVDLSFDLAGDLVQHAQAQFEHDWCFATHATAPGTAAPATAAASEQTQAQLIASGPDQSDDTLYALLVSSVFAARTRIIVITPYFVPDATLLLALTLAARRGVRVDLVLPRRSNHRLADLARHAALRDMSEAGARVWLSPRMLHAKAVIVDDDLALAGSANLDERSLFLNYELMFAFYTPVEVQRFMNWIERQRSGAALYHARPPGVVREFGEGLIRWLAFQL